MNSEILYPLGLIAVMILAMLLVVFGAAMMWFRFVDRRLRQCPECKKPGSGYISESVTLDKRSHMDFKGRAPVRVTIEEVEDTYVCEACDHSWMIPFKRTERTKVKRQTPLPRS